MDHLRPDILSLALPCEGDSDEVRTGSRPDELRARNLSRPAGTEVHVDPLQRRGLVHLGPLRDEVVDFLREILESDVPNVRAGHREHLDGGHMESVGRVDRRRAPLDVGHVRAAVRDNHVPLERWDLRVALPDLRLERDRDGDARRHVHERPFRRQGGVERRQRVVVRRDDGHQVGPHDIRHSLEGLRESIEPDASGLQVPSDLAICPLGRCKSTESGRGPRVFDVDGSRRPRFARTDHPIEIDFAKERRPGGDPIGLQSVQRPESEPQHPFGLAAGPRQFPDQPFRGDRADRDDAVRLFRFAGPRDVRPGHRHSRDTISFFDSRAASRVCHGRLAHLTRTGNSDTPERTASFPRA